MGLSPWSSPRCEEKKNAAWSGILNPNKPLDLIIRFNCQAAGRPVITVRIPFADDTLEDVVFSFIKDNGGPAGSRGGSDDVDLHPRVFRIVGCVSRAFSHALNSRLARLQNQCQSYSMD